jgi:hypothetical protein
VTPRFDTLTQVLVWAQFVLLPLLILRIWLCGLLRKYPFFSAYLAMSLAQIVASEVIPYSSRAYGYVYVFSEMLIVGLYVLVVLELYSKVLAPLSGVASIAQKYTVGAICVAALVSICLLYFEAAARNLVQQFLVFERVMIFSLVLFVLFIVGFLTYFPVSLSRNVLVYSTGYAVFFLAKAASIFARNSHLLSGQVIDQIHMTVNDLCLVFWVACLNRAGEVAKITIGHRTNPGDEQRVMQQLDSINRTLARLPRQK